MTKLQKQRTDEWFPGVREGREGRGSGVTLKGELCDDGTVLCLDGDGNSMNPYVG